MKGKLEKAKGDLEEIRKNCWKKIKKLWHDNWDLQEKIVSIFWVFVFCLIVITLYAILHIVKFSFIIPSTRFSTSFDLFNVNFNVNSFVSICEFITSLGTSLGFMLMVLVISTIIFIILDIILKTKLPHCIQQNEKVLYRISYYIFILFIFVCLPIKLLCIGLFSGNEDSARYLLSALAQSQAAIIALVVTLTLIAVQLASERYSTKIMEIFSSLEKNYPFWLLLLFYVVSIMYDVVVLGAIIGCIDNKIDDKLTMYRISFAIFLTGVALVALFPYTRYIINRIKPHAVVDYLAIHIDENNLEDDGYFIPLIHIIKQAMKKGDMTIGKAGIYRLLEIHEKVYTSKQNEQEKFLIDNLREMKEKYPEQFIKVFKKCESIIEKENNGKSKKENKGKSKKENKEKSEKDKKESNIEALQEVKKRLEFLF